jgi:hypothetical protein
LPDGLFLNQKPQFGKFFKGLGLGNVGIFYGHLEYLAAIFLYFIYDHLCSFGAFFPDFGILSQEKSGNPALLFWSTRAKSKLILA